MYGEGRSEGEEVGWQNGLRFDRTATATSSALSSICIMMLAALEVDDSEQRTVVEVNYVLDTPLSAPNGVDGYRRAERVRCSRTRESANTLYSKDVRPAFETYTTVRASPLALYRDSRDDHQADNGRKGCPQGPNLVIVTAALFERGQESCSNNTRFCRRQKIPRYWHL